MSKKTIQLLDLLRAKYPYPDGAFIPEFRGGTGWSVESRADAIAMHLWPSKGLELIGFELKTSRADWLRELKQPNKADPIKQFCDRWYLVTSEEYNIARREEVPEDWGYMSLRYFGKIETIKEAPKLTPKPIDRYFLASLMRLASNPFNEVIIEGRKYIAEKPPKEIKEVVEKTNKETE